MKRIISISLSILLIILLSSCGSTSTTSSAVSEFFPVSQSAETQNISDKFNPKEGNYDYEEEPFSWNLCGTWHLNDTRYPDAEFSVDMDDSGSLYASFFNLLDESTGAFCAIDAIPLAESKNRFNGTFDEDGWGNSGVILVEFESDPNPDVFGTFYLSIKTTSYGEYWESEYYAANIDRIVLTAGDPPLTEETIFNKHLAAEERSQWLNIDDLQRNPSYYADNSLYRISGTITYISRSESFSYGILQIPNSQIFICFEYPGWLDCLEGDFVLFYGKFSDYIGEYEKNGIPYQTANMVVDDYILRSSDPVKESPVLTDYEWNFIEGTYTTQDSAYPHSQTIEFTRETFNGRPYTLIYVQHNVAGNASSFHHLSDEAIILYIDTTDEYGYPTTISLIFHFSGQLLAFGNRTGINQLYNIVYQRM